MAQQDLDNLLSKLKIDRTRKRPRGLLHGKGKWILVLLLLAFLGYRWYAKTGPIEVTVVKPTLEEVKDPNAARPVLNASGYVIPRNKVEVASLLIGRVKEIYVKRGDQVKAGDVLLRLEDDEQASQFRLAEAQVASSKARLAELEAGSRMQEKEAARAVADSAEATLKNAKAEFDRIENLNKTGVSSDQDRDRARREFLVAQAIYLQARKNADLVEEGPRREEIDAAKAQVKQAEAQLAYAQTQLDHTVIRAPIDGAILEKVAEKGELVTNTNFGGTRGAKSSVVTMADLRDLQVELDVNENDLPKVHLGQGCEIRLDSAPDLVMHGEVDEMAPQADRQKATVQVKVRILDPPPGQRSEVNANVTFMEKPSATEQAAGNRGTRVWIPRASVAKDPASQQSRVFVVEDGTARARVVKTGLEGDRGIEAIEGLAGNELLITAPLDRVTDGAKVRVPKTP